MSLQVRLTLALAAFSLVPLAASMAGGFYQSREALLASEKNGLEAVARLKAAELRARVEVHGSDAQRLRDEFAEQRVGKLARGDAAHYRAWRRWVRGAAASVDTTTDVAVLDLEGTVRAASHANMVGQSWAGAPGLSAGRLGVRASGPHRLGTEDLVVQDAVYAPLRVDGVTVAQLAVVGDATALRSWLSAELPPGSRTEIRDLDGRPLITWPEVNSDRTETVSARTELYPGGTELTVLVPIARVMQPFLILRRVGIGALVLLTIGAVIMAVMMARRIVTREQMLQNRLIHHEKLAAVGSLAAGVAHEIGNPLASLSSLVQVRLRRASDQAERADLELILDQVDRMNRTVKSLTRAARGSNGGKRRVLLQDLVARAVELVRYDPRARGVSLVVKPDPSAPPLHIDEDMWLQLLMNLLVNALDAVAGVSDPEIIVAISSSPEAVTLDVSDNGCGMTEEVRARATDPLFTTKAPGSGTGLGLHQVAEVVARHGGDLEIGSSARGGAEIRIVVPRQRFSAVGRRARPSSQN